MLKHLIFSIVAMWSLLIPAHADEGMWLPWNLSQKQWEKMKEMGLQLSPEEIFSTTLASIKDAVVMLDSGNCTGSFVSPRGLVLTNHHCAFSEIQSHSTVTTDYLKNGFWASSLSEELPNPGKTASVLIKTEDVTSLFSPFLNDELKSSEREKKIDSISALITDTASRKGRFTARINDFYYQGEFHLFVYETFRDVRLVAAPPENIAQFGGNSDNWNWPRHSADFALFRVYARPDGTPSEYSPQNVPYEPKKHLPVTTSGLKEDDFTMILGYPGDTQRFMTSFGIEETTEILNPVVAEVRKIKQRIWKYNMHRSPRVGIQYADKYATSSNYQRFASGQTHSVLESNLVNRRKALEEDFENWVASDSVLGEKYHQVLTKAHLLYLLRRKLAQTSIVTSETLINGPDINEFALEHFHLHNALENNEQQEIERITRQMKSQSESFFKDFDAQVDREVFEAMIGYYQANMDDSLGLSDDGLFDRYKSLEKLSEAIYSTSIFTNTTRYNKFLEKPSFQVLDEDPAFRFMMRVAKQFAPVYTIVNRFEEQLDLIMNTYLDGIKEMQPGRLFYPDANSTMRLTYGSVGRYSPKDGVIYKAFTTPEGLIEKSLSDDECYHLPDSLLNLYSSLPPSGAAANDNDPGSFPLCFISTNDITGGNSGSAVLNGKGQIVGLAFDGNLEGTSSDLEYMPALQKCVSVDIRYVIYLMKELGNAGHLIAEMDIAGKSL